MRTALLQTVRRRALPVVLASVLAAGCAGQRVQTAMPAVPPPPPVEAYDAQGAVRAAAYQENSIYVAGGEMTSLFQDTKARRAGDIVTV
ncbi:MAG TPA: hypothetical protein VLH81_05090, partial [Desulfobacterales bacterium]|nr:hypothetical protein [Desulfobacterales bacterium]